VGYTENRTIFCRDFGHFLGRFFLSSVTQIHDLPAGDLGAHPTNLPMFSYLFLAMLTYDGCKAAWDASGDKDVYKTYEEEDALAEQEFVSKEPWVLWQFSSPPRLRFRVSHTRMAEF
jgi:hypothetical protein